jgi:hypothetical protein
MTTRRGRSTVPLASHAPAISAAADGETSGIEGQARRWRVDAVAMCLVARSV